MPNPEIKEQNFLRYMLEKSGRTPKQVYLAMGIKRQTFFAKLKGGTLSRADTWKQFYPAMGYTKEAWFKAVMEWFG